MFKQYLRKTAVIFICLLIVIVKTSVVLAQQDVIQINKLDLEVLPEYDTQDILVLNSIQLKNTSNQDFSGEIIWRIPQGSTKNIVTEKGNDKHLQYRITSSKDYDEMIFTLQNPIKPGEIKDYHLEFYYNNLQGNPDKTFSFNFVSAYSANQISILVLQPTKATNFKVPTDYIQQANQGGNFFVKRIQNMAKDNKVEFTANYTKTDPNPSFLPPSQQAAQGQPGVPNQANISKTSNIVVFSLAGFAVVIVLIITKAAINRNTNDEYEDDDEYEDEYEEEDEIERQQYKIKRKITQKKNSSGLSKEQFIWLQKEKVQLREKLESGRMTEVDYYESLLELEEEARGI